ncbi:hypothetical protein CK203_005372 [Vitis vinifera]|uniref:Uncharacterized protein n=1 Tax=Vitis vinifera TaxID=29760 RepID=A0A438KE48_VITVI|nr:hypothetical protein CK203_005372 [Vitis vinifera]
MDLISDFKESSDHAMLLVTIPLLEARELEESNSVMPCLPGLIGYTMTEMMANHSDSQHFELKNLKEMIFNVNERDVVKSCAQHSNGECMEIKEPTDHVEITEKELLEKGYMQYGYGFYVHIIGEGAALELHVAMRFLIVAIVIMKQRQVTLILVSIEALSYPRCNIPSQASPSAKLNIEV